VFWVYGRCWTGGFAARVGRTRRLHDWERIAICIALRHFITATHREQPVRRIARAHSKILRHATVGVMLYDNSRSANGGFIAKSS
jgi:hypothetical protein